MDGLPVLAGTTFSGWRDKLQQERCAFDDSRESLLFPHTAAGLQVKLSTPV